MGLKTLFSIVEAESDGVWYLIDAGNMMEPLASIRSDDQGWHHSLEPALLFLSRIEALADLIKRCYRDI